MVSSDIAKTLTTCTYDTLGNLTYEKVKNKNVDYQYNELNQLVYRQDSQNQTYTYSYDLRGNRIAETGKKEAGSTSTTKRTVWWKAPAGRERL